MDRGLAQDPPSSALWPMAANKVVRLVYKRKDGKWAWHLRVGANVIATDGGQGYESRTTATRMANAVVEGDYSHADKQIRETASEGKPPAGA